MLRGFLFFYRPFELDTGNAVARSFNSPLKFSMEESF